MGVFGRLARLMRAPRRDGEEALISDVARLVTQTADQVGRAREAWQCCIEAERRLAMLRDREAILAARLLEYARRALACGDETRAREAVEQQVEAVRQRDHYHRLLHRQREGTIRIRTMLQALERQAIEVEQQWELLQVRAHILEVNRAVGRRSPVVQAHALLAAAEEAATGEMLSEAARGELDGGALAARIDALDCPPAHQTVEAVLGQLRADSAGQSLRE